MVTFLSILLSFSCVLFGFIVGYDRGSMSAYKDARKVVQEKLNFVNSKLEVK